MAELTEHTAAVAVVEWIGDTCAIPAERRFPYPQATKTEALPDASAWVNSSRVQVGPDQAEFPLAFLQQVWLTIFVVEFQVMVEQGVAHPDDAVEEEVAAETAQAQLYDYATALRASIRGRQNLDGKLDGVGQLASPLLAFDFTVPFIEYEDGTRGRVMPGSISVAQQIPDPT